MLPGLTGPAASHKVAARNPGLEAALYREPCSEGRHYSRRQRAHILGLTYAAGSEVWPHSQQGKVKSHAV